MNMCKIRIKRFAGLLFLCFFFAQYSITYAQVEIITGTITDNKGIPLPGVNILEDAKTYNGSVTDFDGNFIIKANFLNFDTFALT